MAETFTEALAVEPLDLAVIGRLWSRDGGMGNERSEEDYSDEGCRVLARHAFRDVNDLLAEVRELRESRERAIRWAVHLENQAAAFDAQLRERAEEWRNYNPGAFYPEASAYANGIENCGDALIDLLDDFAGAALAGGEQ